jgi:hypothetical protein
MRGHATRLITFVLLLLGIACVLPWRGESVSAASQPNQLVKVYLPILHVNAQPATSELHIVHMGLYQSVQSASNGVTLIADKPALLRVYAQASQFSGSTPLASVTVEASRDGATIGSLTIGPEVVPSEPTADDLDSTFNFDLPVEWLRGQVTLTATIDSANDVSEPDETNNSSSADFTFQTVPPLSLTIVPIQYVDIVTGITFTEPAHDPITPWLLAAFPISHVNVSYHSPLTFMGDLRRGEEWSRLLEQLTSLWAAEVGPESPHVYYGLVPNSAPGGESWFPGGISGYGWIGQRVSVGIDFGEATGENAGHEIGHNLGRQHAPCGNPVDVDPHYPYPNASIGVYGVDTSEEILLDPNQTRDMMSYCGPEWVSDYTYEGLLQDQLLKGNQTGTEGDGLLVRAVIDVESDDVELLPVSFLDRSIDYTPDGVSGDHQIQLVDNEGVLIGSYPATLFEAEEAGMSTRMLIALVPSPASGQHLGLVRFLEGDVIIAEQPVTSLWDAQGAFIHE